MALVVGELLASLQGPASRRAVCLGGSGPAERAEGIGQMREGGAGQRCPQQAVELAVEVEAAVEEEVAIDEVELAGEVDPAVEEEVVSWPAAATMI